MQNKKRKIYRILQSSSCFLLAAVVAGQTPQMVAADTIRKDAGYTVSNKISSQISMYSISDCASFWNGNLYYHDLIQRPQLSGDTSRIKKGIDVSSYNKEIDWSKVSEDSEQISFVILRIGLRGTAEKGILAEDASFAANYAGAKSAGLASGAYFFSQATSAAEAKEEAEYVLARLESMQIQPEDLKYPIFMDVEYASGKTAGTYSGRLYDAHLTKSEQTVVCKAFLDTIRAAGYRAGIYANKSMYQANIDTSGLGSDTGIWLANYTSKTSDTGNYDFWQCSQSGQVDGISTAVDLNFYYDPDTTGDLKKENELTGQITATKKTSGKNTITFQWKSEKTADGYIVWRSDSYNGSYAQAGRVTGTTFTDRGLEECREYYYKIQPYAVSQNNAQSYVIGEAGNICAISTNGTIWKRRTTADVNFRNYAGTEGSTVLGKIPQNTVLSIQAKTTAKNGQTWYKVTYGTKTGYVSAGYTVPYTSAVSGLSMKAQTTSAIQLSWKKASQADGYVVYRMTSANGSAKAIATINNVATVTYTDKKLTTGSTYYYKIRAFRRENGYQDVFFGSPSATVKMAARVAQVSGIKQNKSKTSKKVIAFQWKKVNGADGYEIYRSSARNGSYKKVARISNGKTLSWQDKNKSSGTEYYYKIRAYRTLGGKSYPGDFGSVTAMATKTAFASKKKTTKKTTLKKIAENSGAKIVILNKKTVFSIQCCTKDSKGKTWYKGTCKVKKKSYTGYLPASVLR